MRLENFEQLNQGVIEAQMVLVGLGEEWIVTDEMIMSDLADKNKSLYQMFQIARTEERFQKLLPVFTAYYYKKFIPEKVERAYRNMYNLLEGKNYFIVSLTVDPYLKKFGFKEERCVNPCGTYEKLQCEQGCQIDFVSSEVLLKEIEGVLADTEDTACNRETLNCLLGQCADVLENYRCAQCGAAMYFNLLDAKKYREEGYLDHWQTYMKWLQGTLNKELCVIEAGVGVKHPSVIRWPFEKTVFYNQKAKMFRIHKVLYQINEEIAERACGCKCHSVNLFSERNVEA